ncbi:hypothetical protein MAR_022616 [Mya arenaria]|uniref:Ig-like domain-containing protein n=1 Tax=Mya arenaria TaxID=6604 RepID=A0ABY7DMY0_MYAAR|nr:hypothetical protein MAR_022616 [Mya arenaria]
MYTSVYLGFVTFVILMRCNGQFFPTLKPSPRAGVIAGNDLQLICSYDGIENVTICTWKIDGGSVGILRLLDTGCIVYQSLANTTLYNATCLGNNMFSVVLKHVKKEYHGMRWDCEMRIGGSYYKSNTSEIYVAVPVASVTFEPPSSQHITLNENSTYKAQCRTTPARPLAVISWRNDSKTHDLLDDDKDVIAEVTHTTEKNGTIVTTISTVKEEKPVSTALTVTSSVLGSAVFILIVVLLLLCFRKRANVLTSKGTEDMKLDPLQTQREASYTDLTRPSPDQDNQYDTINAASTM